MITEDLIQFVEKDNEHSVSYIAKKFKCTNNEVMEALDEVNRRVRENHLHDSRKQTRFTLDEGVMRSKERCAKRWKERKKNDISRIK